jgi:iron uptake system component EfeO
MTLLPRLAAVTASGAVLLTGCVANSPAGDPSAATGTITVTSTDTTCEVSSATATSGTVRFRIVNSGSQTT